MGFLDKPERRVSKTEKERKAEQARKNFAILAKDRLPPLKMIAPPPNQVGTVSWAADVLFGGKDAFEDLLISMVSVGREQEDLKWRRLVNLILKLRESDRRFEREYTLNQVCQTLDINANDVLAYVGKGLKQFQKTMAEVKASLHAVEMVGIAVEAARDTEKGGKDREMVLKIAGVMKENGGVAVNVQQNNTVKIGKEELMAPLRQFQGLQEEIDDSVRGQIVEGEIVE